MASRSKFQVFIGWSDRGGDVISKEVAECFKDLIENTVSGLLAFVSKSSLRSGTNWFAELSIAASTASWGVFCISDLNHWARWMAFEAGMVAAGVQGAKSVRKSRPVVALLLGGASGKTLKDSPFAHFQSRAAFSESDIKALLEEMISDAPNPEKARDGFERRFKGAWKVFREEYQGAMQRFQKATQKDGAELSEKEMAVMAALSHLAMTIHDATTGSQHASRHQPDVKLLLGDVYDALSTSNWEFDSMEKLWLNLNKSVKRGQDIRLERLEQMEK